MFNQNNMENEKFIVVYKDGSWKKVEQSWEYENDPNWLCTIPI